MKRSYSLSSVALMVAMSALTVQGRDHEAHHFNYQQAMDALEVVAPEEFPQHGAPSFVYKSKDNKFVLGIGGMVQGTASFDFGDPIDNGYGFVTSEIPVNPTPGNGAQWLMNAQTSLIYLNFAALPGTINQIGAYINFNFTGENYCPALQYAYIKWRGMTMGYGYTLFTDQEAAAPTIDYQGPNSFTGAQMALVNYEKAFGRKNRWKFGVGLNMPLTSITSDNYVEQVNQRLPDVPVYLQYGSTDGSSHIRCSAILRNMYYRDLKARRNIDQIGWGIKLSGIWSIGSNFSLMGQAVYGKGISSYYQDLTGAGVDMAYTFREGILSPLKSWGGYLGFDWCITQRLNLSGAYSHVRLYPDKNNIIPGDNYRYAQYAVATLMYNFTNWLSGGIEYIYGRRVQPDGFQRHDSRILTGLQVSF